MNLSELWKKFLPTALAVILELVDLFVKRADSWASNHEHTVVGVLLAALVALWNIVPYPKPQPRGPQGPS